MYVKRKLRSAYRVISMFSIHLKTLWILGNPQSALQRLWSDFVDAQAALSLCLAHMPSCRKCCALAIMIFSEWHRCTIIYTDGIVQVYVRVRLLSTPNSALILIGSGFRPSKTTEITLMTSSWAASSDELLSSMRKIAQIQIRMHKVSSGPLLSIQTFCSIQWFC